MSFDEKLIEVDERMGSIGTGRAFAPSLWCLVWNHFCGVEVAKGPQARDHLKHRE